VPHRNEGHITRLVWVQGPSARVPASAARAAVPGLRASPERRRKIIARAKDNYDEHPRRHPFGHGREPARPRDPVPDRPHRRAVS
jgi:hypothetical protein